MNASQLANAIDEMAVNPRGGKMASIAYHKCAEMIRRHLVRNSDTNFGQETEHLRDLLRRAASYGGIEPQLDIEIQAAIEATGTEIGRLRERLGPRGLEVVMIDGAGHYVNEKVKAEIERLRAYQQRGENE